jgi:hypothetical protein
VQGETVTGPGVDAGAEAADELYGFLQFTCALPTPAMPVADMSKREQHAITDSNVEELCAQLRAWLVPPPLSPNVGFELKNLTNILAERPAEPPPPHTWLLPWSRHAAVGLSDQAFHTLRTQGVPLPEGFPGTLDWHRSAVNGAAPWDHYLRVQRARDDKTRSFSKQRDCNDYLIRPDNHSTSAPGPEPRPEAGSLWELQLFFCELLALRRGAIFASHVSERIYNIWLPPGVITMQPDEGGETRDACFALLPVVTVVRRPYRTEWRYAMSLSVLFVPWWPTGPDGSPGPNVPRAMTPLEIFNVVAATGGNTTYVRQPADLCWPMSGESPLFSYLMCVTRDHRRDFCSKYPGFPADSPADDPASPPAVSQEPGPDDLRGRTQKTTLRHWLELLLLTAAELPREDTGKAGSVAQPVQADDTALPDEVLRCLRVNGIWSAMLVTDSLAECAGTSRVVHNRWWPGPAEPHMGTVDALTTGVPAPVAKVFDLFAKRDHGFPPTAHDRIDELASGGRAHMTWRIPHEHIMITAYSRAADGFPSFSSLNLAGWFAYMAVGVSCARQTMYSLTHDTDRLQDIAEISQLDHERIMDLDDVYDLDVAWPAYADFYRRLRYVFGVEQEYQDIKDRLVLLFRFNQAEQRAKEERLRSKEEELRYKEIKLRNEERDFHAVRTHALEMAAAVVGAGILFFAASDFLLDAHKGYPRTVRDWLVLSCFSIFIGLGVCSVFFLRAKLKKITLDQKRVRDDLTHLAESRAGAGSVSDEQASPARGGS